MLRQNRPIRSPRAVRTLQPGRWVFLQRHKVNRRGEDRVAAEGRGQRPDLQRCENCLPLPAGPHLTGKSLHGLLSWQGWAVANEVKHRVRISEASRGTAPSPGAGGPTPPFHPALPGARHRQCRGRMQPRRGLGLCLGARPQPNTCAVPAFGV